ncbi:pectate lyase family protein [Streptomyces sp. 4N509B]|uniref:pectate lyase family protein n=1 Tax=Streptomyces sp. 4N509B TaxID=3457413 RepID=UPI003FD47BBC
MHRRTRTLLLTSLAATTALLAAPALPAATATETATATATGTTAAAPLQAGPIGFASVDALGQNGTTGGAGGPTVTVSTAADLIAAISADGPRVVRVDGMIQLPDGMYDVTSDKTVIGLGADSGITGGGLNIGLPASDAVTSPPADAVHNVIIRNLNFRDASDDSINVQMYSHHVWIDHNDLADGYDGLIDIKRGSSYITVSWNHTHHHAKNMLLGHDDDNAAQDTGYLKVTYHHNWYDVTPQRNPRVRFGNPVHIFNNYYLDNSDTGPACQADSGCLIEGNYFEDVEEPMTNSYSGPEGNIVERNNVFVGETGEPVVGGTVADPRDYYDYTVDDPQRIRDIVMAGAGTTL